jgi:alpha-ketoglutarate-dependent taurine dioxygenase
MSYAPFGKAYIKFDIDSFERNIDSIKNDLLSRKVLIFKNVQLPFEDIIGILKQIHGDSDYLMSEEGRTSRQLFEFYGLNNKRLPFANEYFSRWGVDRWHVDDSWKELVVDIGCMHMTKSSTSGGNTRFVDLERTYDCLDQKDIDFIEKMVSPGWNADTNESPMYRGPEFMHPSIRVHPVTGKLSVFYNGQNTVAKDNDKWVEYKLKLLNIFEQKENMIEISWEDNDLVIWDNRSVAHAVMGGYGHGERIYNKIEIGQSPVLTEA